MNCGVRGFVLSPYREPPSPQKKKKMNTTLVLIELADQVLMA